MKKSRQSETMTRLLLIVFLLTACSTPIPLGHDSERPCYLAVVTPENVATVILWAPNAKPGDLLITRACDEEKTELLMNSVRRNTR